MSFGVVQETPYDLRFILFGTPVRVHPLFWVLAAVVMWDLLQISILLLLVGIVFVFVSILLHEFGHVWMGRVYGTRGYIVLFCFGGLAVGSNLMGHPWKRIAVCAAGPGIQLALWAILKFAVAPFLEGKLTYEASVAFEVLMMINLFWPLLNLLPIWPLDGGQITRDLFTMGSPRNGVRYSLILSIGLCALLAIHAYVADRTGNYLWVYLPRGTGSAIMFAMLGGIGIQSLIEENSRRPWLDDRSPWDSYRD